MSEKVKSNTLSLKLQIAILLVLVFGLNQGHKPYTDKVTLTIEIQGLDSSEGQLVVALFDDRETFLKKDFMNKVQDISNPEDFTIVWEGIPKGKYALSLFHDKNKNKELDTYWYGFPKEPFGFSNNAKGHFGPPTFDQCLFELDENYRMVIII